MLFDAGWQNRLSTVKWLHQQGAEWPSSFSAAAVVNSNHTQVCWTMPVVKWALNNGCTWGDWQCDQLDSDLYNTEWRKRQANLLLDWAHENGCPCNCEDDSD
jgi:hypothetical protein